MTRRNGTSQGCGGSQVQFSIVVPAYNAQDGLAACLRSVLAQDFDAARFELVVVDDASADGSFAIAQEFSAAHANVRAFALAENGGPGIARNEGVRQSRGDWILFLDSDDHLRPGALKRLADFLQSKGASGADVVAYDWAYLDAAEGATGGRTDRDAFAQGKEELLRRYLALQMDGSVIFTAIRRQLIEAAGLRFAGGLHEDVDYLFEVYYRAARVAYLNQVLYLKTQRAASIVNSISERHLAGFMRAWRAIGTSLATAGAGAALLERHALGLIGVVATRVREIVRLARSAEESAVLFAALYRECAGTPLAAAGAVAAPVTKYQKIAARFLEVMRDADLDARQRAAAVTAFMKDIAGKSWSCVDLHHSAFLAPDQIRTCCKRFFVAGEMRGDVALMNVSGLSLPRPNARTILQAKRSLHTRINRADPCACDGCPFLEFKEWGPLERLDLKYLSLEYHSVCNLECAYCSDTYYGGAQAQYDVAGLVEDLRASGALEDCTTVVWGGGEPTVGKTFTPLIDKLVDWLPQAAHRVLTNAVKHSKTVERLLAEDRISITTSVDAGSEAVFEKVRGRPKLGRVMSNLRRYAAVNADAVTVKYIFTDENCSLVEVRGFVGLVREYGLTGCNFQISSDFKRETVAQDAAVAMIAMYGLLTEAGCEVVFFDDLLRQRLSEMQAGAGRGIRQALAEAGFLHVLADSAAIPSFVIWGAGWLGRAFVEKSEFCRVSRVAYFVDSTPAKIGTSLMGHPIRDPSALLESDAPVAIAASQSFPAIYRKYREMGLDPQRLVRQLIL